MYEMDDGNVECGLDHKLVGIFIPWFPSYSCNLFKMSGGEACSNLALFTMLHKSFCRPLCLGSKTGHLINKPMGQQEQWIMLGCSLCYFLSRICLTGF